MSAPDLRECVREALEREGRPIADLGRAMVEAGLYEHDTAIYHWISGRQDIGHEKVMWILKWSGITLTVKYKRPRKRRRAS